MAGFDAFGTTFEREVTATPGTYAAVAHVNEITPPGIEREALDVTAHDSPDQWAEFIGGIKNGGEVSITLHYDPAVHDVLLADLDIKNPVKYQISWPPEVGGSWQFAAVITGFAPAAPSDDKLTAELTFQVSGKPTFDDGTTP